MNEKEEKELSMEEKEELLERIFGPLEPEDQAHLDSIKADK